LPVPISRHADHDEALCAARVVLRLEQLAPPSRGLRLHRAPGRRARSVFERDLVHRLDASLREARELRSVAGVTTEDIAAEIRLVRVWAYRSVRVPRAILGDR